VANIFALSLTVADGFRSFCALLWPDLSFFPHSSDRALFRGAI
jgi:hypothetical protein